MFWLALRIPQAAYKSKNWTTNFIKIEGAPT